MTAAKLVGALRTLAPTTRVRYLRKALDDGATLPVTKSHLSQQRANGRNPAIEAVSIVVTTPHLSDEQKLASLQRDSSGIVFDIRLWRARGALAVTSGKNLDAVVRLLDDCRDPDPNVRATARDQLARHTKLTARSRDVLHAFIDGSRNVD